MAIVTFEYDTDDTWFQELKALANRRGIGFGPAIRMAITETNKDDVYLQHIEKEDQERRALAEWEN